MPSLRIIFYYIIINIPKCRFSVVEFFKIFTNWGDPLRDGQN